MNRVMRRATLDRLRQFAALALFAGALAAPQSTAFAAVDRQQQVKAGYLYNFARFTTWPASKFASPGDAILLCVLENDPLTAALDESLRGKSIDARPLLVRQVQRAEDMRACHVAYLGVLAGERLDAALDSLAGSGVLTIYENGSRRVGGAIHLFVEERRLRFEINKGTAQRERLELSSRLLGVAAAVLE
jgi:hypothetical protein